MSHAPTKFERTPTKLERTLGCLLGGACGDALGAPVEFMSLRQGPLANHSSRVGQMDRKFPAAAKPNFSISSDVSRRECLIVPPRLNQPLLEDAEVLRSSLTNSTTSENW